MCKYINIMVACYSKYFEPRIFKVNRKQLTNKCYKLHSKTAVTNTMSPVYENFKASTEKIMPLLQRNRFVVQL